MLQEGELIGDWVVETQLGAGGMAAVWRCHSRHAPRMKVAVKVLVGGEASLLRREAEALAALKHPGVVTVLAPGEDPDRECLFLVMELVEGQTLRQHMQGGRLSPGRIRQVAREVLGALAYVHSQGVCHRDIKPANIMIRGDGRPVLVDFGIARDEAARSPTGEVLGTPSYLAPERLGGGRVDGPRVDLYAMGISLYEALTGKPAFVTPPELTPEQRAFRIIEMKRTCVALDPGGEVPADLRALVRALTEPDPRKRPASAAEAAAMLDEPVAVEGTVRVSEPVVPVLQRSWWGPAAVGAVLLLGAAGVSVGRALRSLEESPPQLSGEETLPEGVLWDVLPVPEGDELRRTEDMLLLGVPGGQVEPLADQLGAGLLEDGWRMTGDRSSGGVSVELYALEGRNIGVLISVEGPAAFVLIEDLDAIAPGESQILGGG